MKRQDTGYVCPICGQTVRIWGNHRRPWCGHHGTHGDARRPAAMELINETPEGGKQ